MTKSVLLIISGSIAAYKSLDVVRRLNEQNVRVTCVLTKGGEQFVTPLSLAALSGNPVYTELFSLKDETEMGHIRLSRENDLIAVVPASADRIASMVMGRADDLAGAVLLAANKPVLVAPAMNTQMWSHPATQRNVAQLRKDGIEIIEPAEGMLACGETGQGRLAGVDDIVTAILHALNSSPRRGEVRRGAVSGMVLAHDSPHPNPSPLAGEGDKPLSSLKALVTSGPTHEPIDPVRFIGNRSSGKQGHAVAAALAEAGAQVTLVTGPVAEADPAGVTVVHVETAEQMLAACKKALPADIAVCAAAVSDWRSKTSFPHKIKKRANASPPEIELALNPDILRTLSAQGKQRPALVIGFAAETENVKKYAAEKRKDKGCDWIVANDVSGGKIFGQDDTSAHLITAIITESWNSISKRELAQKLTAHIIHFFTEEGNHGKRKHSKTAARR